LPAENRFSLVPGVLIQTGLAEIIPVEPDQDNACAGKVAAFYSSSVGIFQIIPPG
jgi:hypothetical protein